MSADMALIKEVLVVKWREEVQEAAMPGKLDIMHALRERLDGMVGCPIARNLAAYQARRSGRGWRGRA